MIRSEHKPGPDQVGLLVMGLPLQGPLTFPGEPFAIMCLLWKIRIRQQLTKYWVELIEEGKRSSNPTQSCSTSSVNIEEDLSCGRKRKKHSLWR
ncbi:hypothetical protein RND71_042657 [Anisodus tanguticus]|uniref:Uncharacterized protein n=1 Tax=Anisodus tanguticus TaxID=243964 RepID=A0AAE1UUV7_9SOLA|nr:hypothetical protein RND71_042657 [Anisodus tanguticus]